MFPVESIFCTQRPTAQLSRLVLVSILYRIVNTGVGNKVVLKNYGDYELDIEQGDGFIEIARGDPCDNSPSAAAAMSMFFGVPMLFQKGGMSLMTTMAMGLALFGPTAFADTAECSSVPIEVEIYVDAMIEDIVNRKFKAGEYNECSPESKSDFPPSPCNINHEFLMPLLLTFFCHP